MKSTPLSLDAPPPPSGLSTPAFHAIIVSVYLDIKLYVIFCILKCLSPLFVKGIQSGFAFSNEIEEEN